MQSNTTPLQRIWRLVVQESRNIRFLYSYAIIAGAISLVLPIGIQAMMGLVAGGRLSTGWLILVILICAGVLISGITRLAQISILEKIQQRMFVNTAFNFSNKIGFISGQTRGENKVVELSERFLDIITVQKSFAKLLLDFSASVLQIFFGVLLLAVYHVSFLIFGVAVLLTLATIIRFTWKNGISTARYESDFKFKTAYWITEIARNKNLFRFFKNSSYHVHRTDELLAGYLQGRNGHFKVIYRQAAIAIGMKVIVTAVLLLLGSWLLVNQSISLGQFLASEILIITLLSAVEKLILTVENIYDSGIALEKMGYVTDIEIPEEQHIDSHVKITSAPEISIKTLNDPDTVVEIKPGQKVGILGMPGSGRTAILRAILGEQHGQLNLKINNIPVRNVSSEEYNDFTGICFQSSTLFEGTIAENIALREDYNKSEISNLIQVTHLNRFVEEQEHGFEQKIDIQSGGLPNNIARKILLARALYGQPNLLLIDDIWNVFTREELSQIVQYISSLKSTVIIISNVLPVLEQMDKMLFFDNNLIEEYNSPELLSHNPKIKNIVWM